MKQEFYKRLSEVIAECETHPYQNTERFLLPGWEGRISKSNLGEWSDEDYDVLFHRRDKKTLDICNASKLDCFVYCDGGGYIYLGIF